MTQNRDDPEWRRLDRANWDERVPIDLHGLGDRLARKQIVAEKRRLRVSGRSPWRASRRLATLRSRSCFSAPSCGARHSSGNGSAW